MKEVSEYDGIFDEWVEALPETLCFDRFLNEGALEFLEKLSKQERNEEVP